MRYKYCKMHEKRPDKLPEGCQYRIATGKWVKEEWPPHQWGGLLRRWPVVVVAAAKKQKRSKSEVVYAYYTKDLGYTRPDKLPAGCECEDAFDGGWFKETMSPKRWGGLRRRWPTKPTVLPVALDLPCMHSYISKDKVTGIVNQIRDLLRQLE